MSFSTDPDEKVITLDHALIKIQESTCVVLDFSDKETSVMRLIFRLLLALGQFSAVAQDTGSGDSHFQPPPPPSFNPATDFDDMDEDMMEMGDDGNFRAPPPPIPQPGGTAPDLNSSFSDSGGDGGGIGGRSSLGQDKVRFETVPGEYFEPRKKRSRGRKLRAKSSSGN
jgi:hypothetical protein